MPSIKTESTTAYRVSDGRRFFTLRGAVNHYAWLKIKAKHPVESDEDYLANAILYKRYVRFIMPHIRRILL